MSNLSANLTITSRDLLGVPVNITTSSTSSNQNYGKMGSIKINPNEQSRLTEFSCGSNGAYIYVQSPLSNPANVAINLYKSSDETQHHLFSVNTLVAEPESFITLQPGDFAWVPLSATVKSLIASTTNGGSSSLNFLYVDRGGDYGQSVLKVFQDNDNSWKYFIFDASSGQPGNIVDFVHPAYPTFPVSLAGWNLDLIYAVQNKGYVVIFSSTDDYLMYFIGSDGKLISNNINETVDNSGRTNNLYRLNATTSSNNGRIFNTQGMLKEIHYEDGLGYLNGFGFAYTEGYGTNEAVSKLAYFDGDMITYHSFPNCWDNQITISDDSGWDQCTKDGSFVLKFSEASQPGYPSNDFYMVFNSLKHAVIDNYVSGNSIPQHYLSINANVIVFLSTDDTNGHYQRFMVYDTSGKLLKNVDISGVLTDGLDYAFFYGNGNFQMIFEDYTTNNLFYMMNYNSSSNILLGGDLSWNITNSYNYRASYNGNYPIVNYESPLSNYVGGSMSIIFYHTSGYDLSNVVAYRSVDYAYIDYIIGNDTNRRYALTENSQKWINSNSYSSYDQNHALAGAIIVPYVEANTMKTLILLPGDNNYQDISLTYVNGIQADAVYDQQIRPISDTEFFYWTYANNARSYYDVFGIDGNHRSSFNYYQYLWNHRTRVGCLLVRTPAWNTDVSGSDEHSWIYRQSTGSFTDPLTYYPYRRNSNYDTKTKLNDGRILLVVSPDYSSNTTGSFIMRLLTKDSLSDEFVLPKSYGYLYADDNLYPLQIGETHICYFYQNINLEYVFNLYDFDFNLVNSVTLSGLTNLDSYNSGQFGADNSPGYGRYTNGYGKRFYFHLQNSAESRDFYFMITPTSHFLKEVSISGNLQATLYNDIMWAYLNY